MATAIEAIHRNELVKRDDPTPRPPSILDALQSVHQVTVRPQKNRTVARQDRTNDIIVLNEVVVPSGGIIQKGEDVVSIDAKDRHSLKEG